MVIQRGGSLNTKSGHHRKTGTVDDGEILIAPGEPKLPRHFQIRETDRFNNRYAASQSFPKSLRGIWIEPVMEQSPRFDKNMICRRQCLA